MPLPRAPRRLAPDRAEALRREVPRLKEPDRSNVSGPGSTFGFICILLMFGVLFLEALGPPRFVAAGVLFAAAIAGFLVGDRHHKRAEAARVAQRGWTLHERRPIDPKDYARFAALDLRGARVGKRGVSGTHHELPFEAFRVTRPDTRSQAVRRRSKRRHPTTFTVVAVPAPHDHPGLLVRRAGLGDLLTGLVGLKDIQVGNPVFDEAFVVQGTDDQAAQPVLTPAVQDLLAATPQGWIEWHGGTLAWTAPADLTVAAVESGLEVLHHILARLD